MVLVCVKQSQKQISDMFFNFPIGLNRGLPEDSLEPCPFIGHFILAWKKSLSFETICFLFCDSTFWHVLKFDQQISCAAKKPRRYYGSLFWVKCFVIWRKTPQECCQRNQDVTNSWIFPSSLSMFLCSPKPAGGVLVLVGRCTGATRATGRCFACRSLYRLLPSRWGCEERRRWLAGEAVDEKEGNTVKWHDHHIIFDSLSERVCI